MKYLSIIILFCISNTNLVSQGFSYQLSTIYGYKFQKGNFFNDPITGFALDLNKKTNGLKYWQSDHKYPQSGLQVLFRDFKKNSPYQYTISIIPYLEFNLLKTTSLAIQLKHGTGLAYVLGHSRSNENSLLGSKLNASSIIDLGLFVNAGNHFSIKPGLMLSHISNGNLVKPNSGVNSLLGYIQFCYFPGSKSIELLKNEKISTPRKWALEYRLSFGLSDLNKTDKTLGLTMQHLVMQTYQHNTRFRSGLGSELIHDAAFDNIAVSVYAEENVLIGHLVTRYGLGVYINQGPISSSRFYEKVGVAWYPFKLKNATGKGFSIGADIKAHKFTAAHVDLNLGYLF